MCRAAGDRGRALVKSSFIARISLYRNPSDLSRSCRFEIARSIKRRSGYWQNPVGTSQPLSLARISVVEGIEHKFDAAGNAKFLEYAEEIFLDGVLAEAEFAGNAAITQAFGNQSDDLFFTRGEEIVAAGVEHTKRRNLRDQIHQIVQLFGTDP